ncbi:MAG TPA: RcnB family protein [Rhizomicrobium sp.]|nr:RcnB family protein [Rhizomicrobium sp.]
MKRLLLAGAAIAALAAAPAYADSSDHHWKSGSGDHSADSGHHGGTQGGSPGSWSGASHGGNPSGGDKGNQGSQGGNSPNVTGGSHGDHHDGTHDEGGEDHGTSSGGGNPFIGGPKGGDHGDHDSGDHDHGDQDHGDHDHGNGPGFSGGDHHEAPGAITTHDHIVIEPHGTRPPNWDHPPHHFDRHEYERNFVSPHRYHWKHYHRPNGWYFHHWMFGEVLPAFFWTQDYWIDDWWDFELPPPPYGYRWVRVGDDALLVNIYSGEVLQVVYDLFD